MKTNLSRLGMVAGLLGVLICIAAVAGRFYEDPGFLGFRAINVFIVGIGFMVLGCLAKLEAR